MAVSIAEIQPYDHNPRHSANPEYDRIKASVRAEGMVQPLVITRRPDEADFMVQAGGNTRLRVLKELFEETGEARFFHLQCLFKPWTGEADVLLAHLKENDLRGNLTFLDKARAVHEVKRLIAQEAGEDELSQNRLAEILKARGYGLSQGRLSQLAYTVEVLLPLIPQALAAGMGRPQVERLRRLDRAARALWLDREVDTEAEYAAAFAALCRRYDDPAWDTDTLQRALEGEIAERAEISIHAVHMALEARRAGREPAEADAPWQTGPSARDDRETAAFDGEAAGPAEAAGQKRSPDPRLPEGIDATGAVGETSPRNEQRTAAEASDGQTPACPVDEPASTGGEAFPVGVTDPPVTTDPRMPADLKSLRARAWTLAARLAQRNGLGELIQPLSGQGLGFVLSDVPDPALLEQLDADALAQVSLLWWQLAAAAELTVAPHERLLPALAPWSVLRQALEAQDTDRLFEHVWTPDPGHTGYHLWCRLDDRDWADWLALVATYRALHRAAGAALWR